MGIVWREIDPPGPTGIVAHFFSRANDANEYIDNDKKYIYFCRGMGRWFADVFKLFFIYFSAEGWVGGLQMRFARSEVTTTSSLPPFSMMAVTNLPSPASPSMQSPLPPSNSNPFDPIYYVVVYGRYHHTVRLTEWILFVCNKLKMLFPNWIQIK